MPQGDFFQKSLSSAVVRRRKEENLHLLFSCGDVQTEVQASVLELVLRCSSITGRNKHLLKVFCSFMVVFFPFLSTLDPWTALSIKHTVAFPKPCY